MPRQARAITPKQLADLTVTAERILRTKGNNIAAIRRQMQNFDIPAQSSINYGFAVMGEDRFTPGGDDVWEMIIALENGAEWEYNRPRPELVSRWRCA